MKVGIIGGSGLYHLEELEEVEEVDLDTPFGKPSSNLVTGKVNGIPVWLFFLAMVSDMCCCQLKYHSVPTSGG